MLTMTMLAPVGRLILKDSKIPIMKHAIDKNDGQDHHRFKNFLPVFPPSTAGKMIRLEMRRLPIIRMPRTTVRAVKRAMTN